MECRNCGKPLVGESQDDEKQVEAVLRNECWIEGEVVKELIKNYYDKIYKTRGRTA